MQKKTFGLIFLTVLLSLTAVSAVLAADEWVPYEPAAATGEQMQCVIVEPLGPNEQITAALPPITDEDWSIGPEDAPLTILEYADFECPYCANAGLGLIEFQQKYADEVRYVYRHFPLDYHTKAPMAAYAADAAGVQGLFFEAEHLLYAQRDAWISLATLDDFEAWIKKTFEAEIPGLDFEKWQTDFADADLRAKVDGAFDEVAATGVVGGTPTIFLNFNGYQGGIDEASLRKFLEFFKLQSKTYAECPPMLVQPDESYRAVVDTTKGQFVIDLYADVAPLAVNNFIFLAREGWFDGITFHRIVQGFVAQTGDPSASGLGTPGYQFATETHDVKYGEPGMVGMANSGADKNGSQFFITFNLHDYYLQSIKAANDNVKDEAEKMTDEQVEEEVQKQLETMSSNYTIFGKVTEGYEKAEALTSSDVILTIKIESKAK